MAGEGGAAQWRAVAYAAAFGAALLALVPFAPHGFGRAEADGTAPPPAVAPAAPPATTRPECDACTAPLPAPRVHEDHAQPPCPGPHAHRLVWDQDAATCRCLVAVRLACL